MDRCNELLYVFAVYQSPHLTQNPGSGQRRVHFRLRPRPQGMIPMVSPYSCTKNTATSELLLRVRKQSRARSRTTTRRCVYYSRFGTDNLFSPNHLFRNIRVQVATTRRMWYQRVFVQLLHRVVEETVHRFMRDGPQVQGTFEAIYGQTDFLPTQYNNCPTPYYHLSIDHRITIPARI